MRSERVGALLRAACAALAGLCVACQPPEEVLHPDFGDASQLNGVPRLTVEVLGKLEGMYQVARGGNDFGGTTAVHAVKDTLSLYTNAHDNYAILHAGCVSGGTKLILEGYWRYASTSDTGLIRLSLDPPALALALCTGAPLPSPPVSPQLTGRIGRGYGPLKEAVDFRFARALVATTGRFWVAAHHGACSTADDCGASENSLPSIRMVEPFGATDVEVDVRLTADGVAILYHDDNFGPRLAKGVYCHGPVEGFTLADVRANCKLKFGEGVPTLDDALETAVNDTTLSGVWLDLKVGAAVLPALAAQTRYADLARQRGRTIDIILGLGEQDVLEAYLAARPPPGTLCLVELNPDDVRRAGCQFWGPRWTLGPMVDQVRALQTENRAVMFWTINQAGFVDLYLRQAKPNGILSDRPGMVFHRFQTLGTLPRGRIP
jgi:glycerophosphoryl diester phosphodiesterase